MTTSLAHRGPDGESFWNNSSHNVLFGHRRLSIIDLSVRGSQAMHYLNRYTIIYNGEIYNYLEIKDELQKRGYSFTSRSDTEVILASFDCYGESCLDLFDGMFSFAIWDEKEQTLFAARDRFGEKPFYYVHDVPGNFLAFGSEMKALKAAGIESSIDPKKLLLYLGLGYTDDALHTDATFYNNIRQLPPAHFLFYHLPEKKLRIQQYWELDKQNQISISENEAIEKFYALLSGSIKRRLRSDVPIGTSLSGGLDSSAITALISDHAEQGATRKTFSIVFPGFQKDESVYVQKVANAFGLENYSETPTAEGFAKDFQTLLYHHEAPISSASVYLQYKVFELAKRNDVKVLLDGQGADETLAGYTRYIHWYLQELLGANRFSEFIHEKRRLSANGVPFNWSVKNYAAAKFSGLANRKLDQRRFKAISRNIDFEPEFLNQQLAEKLIYRPPVSKLNDVLYFDTCRVGLPGLLRYADRNSMAHGTEVRLPFLSHELVQFVFSLPSNYKIHNGWTKWLLRKAIETKLPKEIVWRREKIGFEPPQKSWMEHGLLKEFLYESKKSLVKDRILKPAVLDKKNQPHDAYAADGLDWRYLVAGQLLNQ